MRINLTHFWNDDALTPWQELDPENLPWEGTKDVDPPLRSKRKRFQPTSRKFSTLRQGKRKHIELDFTVNEHTVSVATTLQPPARMIVRYVQSRLPLGHD